MYVNIISTKLNLNNTYHSTLNNFLVKLLIQIGLIRIKQVVHLRS